MKSWGFLRMRKQWIPGHFSLRPRGLGTRLELRVKAITLYKGPRYKAISYLVQLCQCIFSPHTQSKSKEQRAKIDIHSAFRHPYSYVTHQLLIH